MNLRFLQTLVAVSEHPTFISAANELGLSHSAVSQQIKALEDELQLQIVDRITRPPSLTDDGFSLVELARKMLKIADEIRLIAEDDSLAGSVTIGVVPSALVGLIPPALAELRQRHPRLQVRIRSGLSNDLAQAVRTRDIDLAVVTQPRLEPLGLVMQPICQEPLDIIIPPSVSVQTEVEALDHPFIWFNRRHSPAKSYMPHDPITLRTLSTYSPRMARLPVTGLTPRFARVRAPRSWARTTGAIRGSGTGDTN